MHSQRQTRQSLARAGPSASAGNAKPGTVLIKAAVGVKCGARQRLSGTCGTCETWPGLCRPLRGPPCGRVVKGTRLPRGSSCWLVRTLRTADRRARLRGQEAQRPARGSGEELVAGAPRPSPAADRAGPAAASVPDQLGAVPAGTPALPVLSETADVDGEGSFWSRGPARCLCAGERAAALHPEGFLAVGDTDAVAGTVASTAALPGRGFAVTTKFIAVFRDQVRTGHRDDRYVQTAQSEDLSVPPPRPRAGRRGLPRPAHAAVRLGVFSDLVFSDLSPSKVIFLSSPSESKYTVPRGTNLNCPTPGIPTHTPRSQHLHLGPSPYRPPQPC